MKQWIKPGKKTCYCSSTFDGSVLLSPAAESRRRPWRELLAGVLAAPGEHLSVPLLPRERGVAAGVAQRRLPWVGPADPLRHRRQAGQLVPTGPRPMPPGSDARTGTSAEASACPRWRRAGPATSGDAAGEIGPACRWGGSASSAARTVSSWAANSSSSAIALGDLRLLLVDQPADAFVGGPQFGPSQIGSRSAICSQLRPIRGPG